MPCISCNSQKFEESSLPPRAGQEHCQQQFHHRFVCLHLFFPSTNILPFRQTARAKSNPAVSGLQPGHHPHLHSGHVLLVPLAKSRHQVGVLHIMVTITDTMANIIFTNSIFSIYEAANIHSILDCRERGLCFWCTLNSCFTKEHEKHHDSFSLEKL